MVIVTTTSGTWEIEGEQMPKKVKKCRAQRRNEARLNKTSFVPIFDEKKEEDNQSSKRIVQIQPSSKIEQNYLDAYQQKKNAYMRRMRRQIKRLQDKVAA